MALEDDLKERVGEIFLRKCETYDGYVVPDPEDIGHGNVGRNLDATILYADMKGSTKMVDQKSRRFAAEVYKAYLHCAGKIIEDMDGEITAYDGDRVMAVFLGDDKETNAATCALKINWAVRNIVNPGIVTQYGADKYKLRHIIGVDSGNVLVARTGVWGNNDLVWVGPAANYAAKLCDLGADGHSAYITHRVYDAMSREAKYSGEKLMWERRGWTPMDGMTIYRSNWTWGL